MYVVTVVRFEKIHSLVKLAPLKVEGTKVLEEIGSDLASYYNVPMALL